MAPPSGPSLSSCSSSALSGSVVSGSTSARSNNVGAKTWSGPPSEGPRSQIRTPLRTPPGEVIHGAAPKRTKKDFAGIPTRRGDNNRRLKREPPGAVQHLMKPKTAWITRYPEGMDPTPLQDLENRRKDPRSVPGRRFTAAGEALEGFKCARAFKEMRMMARAANNTQEAQDARKKKALYTQIEKDECVPCPLAWLSGGRAKPPRGQPTDPVSHIYGPDPYRRWKREVERSEERYWQGCALDIEGHGRPTLVPRSQSAEPRANNQDVLYRRPPSHDGANGKKGRKRLDESKAVQEKDWKYFHLHKIPQPGQTMDVQCALQGEPPADIRPMSAREYRTKASSSLALSASSRPRETGSSLLGGSTFRTPPGEELRKEMIRVDPSQPQRDHATDSSGGSLTSSRMYRSHSERPASSRDRSHSGRPPSSSGRRR